MSCVDELSSQPLGHLRQRSSPAEFIVWSIIDAQLRLVHRPALKKMRLCRRLQIYHMWWCCSDSRQAQISIASHHWHPKIIIKISYYFFQHQRVTLATSQTHAEILFVYLHLLYFSLWLSTLIVEIGTLQTPCFDVDTQFSIILFQFPMCIEYPSCILLRNWKSKQLIVILIYYVRQRNFFGWG